MQPFDVFKERLVRYRMAPQVSERRYEAASQSKPSLTKSIAKARLIVAGCAAIAMTVVFVGLLATH